MIKAMRIFDFFTKRKQKHSVSVDAMKEQNSLLLKRLKKVESELLEMKVEYKSTDSQVADGKSATTKAKDRYEERQQQMLRPIHDMAAFVIENFEFRHNIVRDLYEYRRKGSDNPWKLIDKRQLNSINCRIQDEGEIFVLSSYVKQRIESELAVDYHPVRAYLNKVRGQWDGKTDYIADFARRISSSDYCQCCDAVAHQSAAGLGQEYTFYFDATDGDCRLLHGRLQDQCQGQCLSEDGGVCHCESR